MKQKQLGYPYIWSVIFIILWAVFYFVFGEKISHNQGCGYDGFFYCTITQNFESYIRNLSFSFYYIQRVLPCAIVYLGIKILGFPLSIPNIITGFYVLNTVLWVLFIVIWHKILNRFRISAKVQWLMAVLILINFYVLKFTFYYPVLTDGSAIFLGSLMLWFYIRDKKIGILIVALLGAFVYPLFFIYASILFLFPSNFTLRHIDDCNKNRIDYYILFFCVTVFAILRTVFAYKIQHPLSVGFHLNTLLFMLSYGYVLYYILPCYQVIKANLKHLLRHLTQKNTLKRIGIVIILFAITVSTKLYFSQHCTLSEPKKMYFVSFLLGIELHGAVWMTEAFSSFGLIIVFLIFLLKKSQHIYLEKGIGFYVIMFFFYILLLQAEMRDSIDIYPFALLFLALIIEREYKSIKIIHILVYGVINLALSKFFLPLENTSMIYSKIEHVWVPRYYALSSYLMNDEQYVVLLIACIPSFLLTFYLTKTKGIKK